MIKNLWAKISYAWFLFMLIIVGFFTGNLFVNATTTDRWALMLPNITDGRWFDCTSSTNCNNQLASVNVNANSRYYIAGDTSVTLASNGVLIGSFSPYTLQKGYVYAVALYVCSNKNLANTTHDMYTNAYSNRGVNNTIYNSTGRGSLTNEPFVAGTSVGNYCYVYQGSIVPDTDSSWVFLRLKSSSAITGFVPAIVSMTVEGIGTHSSVISSAVSSAIQNKGLATQTDLNNMQTSINNKQQETTNAVNNVDDTINNNDVDNPSSSIDEFEDLLPSNGVITQLIGLPITLYTKVLNSINGTCSQFNLGNLYGTDLIMPCIDVDTYLGSSLWNVIDIIISGGFVLVIAKKMIKSFENFTSMKEGDVINND